MSTAKASLRTSALPKLSRSQRPSFWENRLGPFLEKHWVTLCVWLIAVACLRIVATYEALSLTMDEPFHLACAIEYLTYHTPSLDLENPPLARAVQAIGPYLAGARPAGKSEPRLEGVLVVAHAGNFDRTVLLMRIGTLPFFLLACLVVAAWSRHSFGKPVAVLAVGLFTLLPTILADAGLNTTDMALGATVGAAFFAAVLWAERPTWLRALLTGGCAALALLTKYTALGYVPFALFLALVCYLAVRRPTWPAWWQVVRQRLPTFALAIVTMALLIWATYWFSYGIIRRIHLILPAPDYFHGMAIALRHGSNGHGAFLLGEYRTAGWWYYFPVALAVKTPIAFLLLVGLGMWVCVKQRRRIAYLLPLAFSAGILLPPMFGRVDIGIRHIEPIYIGLSIIAALGLVRLLQSSRFEIASVLAAAVLVLWMIVSVAIHHPDYLAYFNGFAGKHPENILVDSNYDWGQSLRFLATRLHELGVEQFALASLDGTVGHAEYLEAWYGLPPAGEVDDYHPSPGWSVIGATFAKSYRLQMGRPKEPKPWYETRPPTERVGPLFLYYIPPNHKPSSSSAPTPAVARP